MTTCTRLKVHSFTYSDNIVSFSVTANLRPYFKSRVDYCLLGCEGGSTIVGNRGFITQTRAHTFTAIRTSSRMSCASSGHVIDTSP